MISLRKIRSFRCLVMMICLIGPFGATGQGTFPNHDLRFDHITEGLSQNTVVSILQDKYGFLWIGTRNGLNRYDGVQFKIYERSISDPKSLGHGYVNTLYEDSYGDLWVGTQEGGLSRYNWATDDFTHYQHDPLDKHSISGNSVLRIYEDSKGNFWVGTEHYGLNLFDRATGTFRRMGATTNELNLADKQITGIFEDRLDQVWIATRFDGLFLFNPDSETFTNYRSDPDDESTMTSSEIRRVFKGNDENIWIGTTRGLNLMYVDRTGEVMFKRFLHDDFDPNTLTHDAVVAIAEDDFGNLWFGTENGGLSIYKPETDVFRNYKYDPIDEGGLASNSFWYIYKDRDGTMWLAPLNRGLSKVEKTPSQFSRVQSNPADKNSLSHNNVTRLMEDSKGNLWIGTDGGGLNFYNRKTNQFTHFRHDVFDPSSIGSDAVISILEDHKGRIWAGTWAGGLNLLDPVTGRFKRFQHDPDDPSTIASDHIFAMMEDSKGRFWVGAYLGGLDLFDPETGTFEHFKARYNDSETVNENEIEDIIEDRNGNLWIATRGGGLNKLRWEAGEEPIFSYYLPNSQDPGSISSNTIISLLEDSEGHIWAGSEGGGLNKLDPTTDRFTKYTKEDGLPNDVVHGILEDERGNLWLSTNKGISRFNTRSGMFKNYDVSDGLQANEFIRGAYFEAADGSMMFGGINGFNIFDPARVIENRELPVVHITDFYVYDERVIPSEDAPLKKAIIESNRIELDYSQSAFQFEFAGLSFKQAEKNEYAFILEGYDSKWRYVGNQRQASYTRVPPGEYVFKVKASNNDHHWNEAGAEVVVIITPPWWQTWWAYLLYTTTVVGLLYGAWMSIIRRERLKSNLKLEHLELVKMQEMDQLKSRFFANISHEFRTPLSLILGPLRSIYYGTYEGNPKKQFAIMIRNGQRLLQLINQLLDLSKLESGKMQLRVMRVDVVQFLKPILASFTSHAQRQSLQYDMKFLQEEIMAYIDKDKLEKIVLNLLSNAFKFTPEFGSIEIKVGHMDGDAEFPDGSVLIKIADSGIGISGDKLAYVFDRFYQVDGNHDDKRKGTGIGLSLTKELVELHGGKITVESQDGKGSIFTVLIPIEGDHLNKAEIIDAELEKELDAGEVSDSFKNLLGTDQSPERTLEANSKIESLQSVLIIDDNEDIRSYLVNQLEVNYKIMESDNGIDGFSMAVEELPDLIISDVMMPGINGLDLCKKIKGDERTCHIPVILLTAKADSENKIEGFEAGADYYVTKPFNSNILELRVRNILKAREMVREHYASNSSLELEPSNVQLTSPDEIFLKRALESVENNMANSEFSVEDFGRDLGMSRMQLYRKMKALTGQSANEFIRSIRLKRAAQLIEQNHFTIAEVTYEVGFNDLQYFRDCFKKQFGVNPSKYPFNTSE